MKMFSPFSNVAPNKDQANATEKPSSSTPLAAVPPLTGDPSTAPSHLTVVKTTQLAEQAAASPDQLAEMRSQLAVMQTMIEKLAKDRS